MRNSLHSWRQNKNVFLGCSFLGGFLSCFIDFDHVLLWVFNIRLGWVIPNLLWKVSMEGRNLHSLLFWIPVCVVLAGGLASSMARRIQPATDTC